MNEFNAEEAKQIVMANSDWWHKDDVIAALKERDAEIERLKAALIKIRSIDWGTDHCDEKNMIADAALKGEE